MCVIMLLLLFIAGEGGRRGGGGRPAGRRTRGRRGTRRGTAGCTDKDHALDAGEGGRDVEHGRHDAAAGEGGEGASEAVKEEERKQHGRELGVEDQRRRWPSLG